MHTQHNDKVMQMDNLVRLENGKLTVTSKELADVFGKNHRHVIRDVESLECSQEFGLLNFEESTFTTSQNKKHKCYKITRDGFAFLAMGFTGRNAAKWKEAYIKAFNEMESNLRKDPTFMDKINEAIGMLEGDKEKASACATGLNAWKKIKSQRESEVKRLISASQMLLSLDK